MADEERDEAAEAAETEEGQSTEDTLRDTLATAMGEETDDAGDARTEEAATEAAPEAEVEEQAQAIDPPEHWAVDHQEMFRGLDPKAQAFLMDRSKDMEAAHTKRSQEIAPFRSAVEKWTPYLAQTGATPDRVFDQLMGFEYALRTGTNEQRVGVLLQLANMYGVQLGQPEAPSAEEDPFQITQRIQQAVAPLAQQVQQVAGGLNQNVYAQQQGNVAAAQRNIDAFREEKGADGKPAHPHFEEVGDDMLVMAQALVSQGRPVDLAELYERAVWANPSVRAKVQAAESRRAQQATRKAEQERAKRQRAAAGSLAGGGGGGKEQPKDRRAALESAWDAAAGA